MGHGEANLAARWPAPEDLAEGRAAGRSEDQPQRQEGELALAHAGSAPLSKLTGPTELPASERSCGQGARQPVAAAAVGRLPNGSRFAARTGRVVDSSVPADAASVLLSVRQSPA